MSEFNPQISSGVDVLALELTRVTGRFSKTIGRVPGNSYSPIAWRVLAELSEGRPTRVSELAQRQRVAQPSMTGLVQRLEAEAWVERSPDPADGRATLVGITEKGRAALDDYRRAAAARVRPYLDELSPFDRATLARSAELMQQLADRIEPRPG